MLNRYLVVEVVPAEEVEEEAVVSALEVLEDVVDGVAEVSALEALDVVADVLEEDVVVSDELPQPVIATPSAPAMKRIISFFICNLLFGVAPA